jgi:hypothetical protein
VPQVTIPVRLTTSDFERAKAVASGWDIYWLEQEWRVWIEKKRMPTMPVLPLSPSAAKSINGKGYLDRNGSIRAQESRGETESHLWGEGVAKIRSHWLPGALRMAPGAALLLPNLLYKVRVNIGRCQLLCFLPYVFMEAVLKLR